MPRKVGPIVLHSAPSGASRSDATLDALATGRVEAAFERGREQGRGESLESGASALDAVVERLDAAVDRAQEELSHHAVELAIEIARQLLKVQISAEDFDLEQIVRGSLADAGVGRGNVVVHLHPDDHARLQDVVFRSGTQVEIDPNLSRGDVHLATPRGLLVRELEPALDSIREQLLENLA